MHEKCLVNDDVIAARAVLEAQEPHQAKQIGGKVKITDKWSNAKCKSVMKDLLKNKFSEGSELARELLATGDTSCGIGTRSVLCLWDVICEQRCSE